MWTSISFLPLVGPPLAHAQLPRRSLVFCVIWDRLCGDAMKVGVLVCNVGVSVIFGPCHTIVRLIYTQGLHLVFGPHSAQC